MKLSANKITKTQRQHEPNTINPTVDDLCIEINNKNITNFDDVLSTVGQFGRYQKYLFLLNFPFYFYLAFVYNGQLFITEDSDKYWCWIPELKNLTSAERLSIAIPLDNSSIVGHSRCRNYKTNWTDLLATSVPVTGDWETEECQNGWEFERSEIAYPTITSEMGWVCAKDSYQATAQSIFFSGAIVGGFLVGYVADHYGRLPALILSNLLSCAGGVCTAFVTNFTQFVLCRFVVGLGYDNVVTMMYILVLEYTAPKYRSLMANISYAIFYCLSTSLLPWIALACGHWRVFSLVTSVPMALSVVTYFVLPESPRWLLSKGKVDQTVNILKNIAAVNGKSIPQPVLEGFITSASSQESEKVVSLLQLVRRPLLLRLLLLQAAIFISSDIAFDVLLRMSGKIGFNFAISFTLSSITEFPSLIILICILDRCGRRWLYFGSMITCGVFSIAGAFVPSGIPTMACCVLARFFVNMGYSTAMQWAAECLPTPARASGVACIHVTSFVAIMTAPFIVYLETVSSWLPLLVTGVVAGAGAAGSLHLPETTGRAMPQTLADAELLMAS